MRCRRSTPARWPSTTISTGPRLLDAALGFVAGHDIESLTLAELAKRTGRSRASSTRTSARPTRCGTRSAEHTLTTWVDEVLADIAHASTPGERLDRFITTQITRRHGPTVERILTYVLAQQSGPLRAQLRTVTEPLTTELLAIIEQLGVAPPAPRPSCRAPSLPRTTRSTTEPTPTRSPPTPSHVRPGRDQRPPAAAHRAARTPHPLLVATVAQLSPTTHTSDAGAVDHGDHAVDAGGPGCRDAEHRSSPDPDGTTVAHPPGLDRRRPVALGGRRNRQRRHRNGRAPAARRPWPLPGARSWRGRYT